LDVEAAISYTVQFIRNLARQWLDLRDANQKQRLQQLVFPEGLVYDKATGSFCTAVLSPVLRLNQEFTGDESDFVAGVGLRLHQIVQHLKEWMTFAGTTVPLKTAA